MENETEITKPTYEELAEALHFCHYAITQYRDDKAIQHSRHGHLFMEEVKTCVLDPLLFDEVTDEKRC